MPTSEAAIADFLHQYSEILRVIESLRYESVNATLPELEVIDGIQERLGDFHMALEMTSGFQPNEFYGWTTHQYLDSFGWGALGVLFCSFSSVNAL
jgi:hypothetical protein